MKKMMFLVSCLVAALFAQANKAFRHHLAVFVPEVKKIANDKNFSGVLFNAVEKRHDPALAFQTGGMVGRAQVKVG